MDWRLFIDRKGGVTERRAILLGLLGGLAESVKSKLSEVIVLTR